MRTSASIALPVAPKDAATDVLDRYSARLAKFIRRRVPDRFDAEDVLQEVLREFVESGDTAHSIDQVGAWLFRVARSRIIDLFRKKRPERSADLARPEEEGSSFEDLLPSAEAGPDEAYARGVLMRELADAIDELPEEQRYVFIAHEIEGRSFKELAAETGVRVNTLISRKRYAVVYLRRRLEDIYEDFKTI